MWSHQHSPSCHGNDPWPNSPKEVGFAMRKYEVMIIVDPEVDDRQVSALVDKHVATITNANGTVENIDIWGRRRFAYDINKKSEGTYVVVNLTAEPAAVKEMDRLLSIDEQIMRTKVLRADDKPAKADETK